MTDREGFLWDIQGDGSIGDGNNDTFDGGNHLIVNEQRFQGGPLQPGTDAREVVIGPANIGGLNVTRKIRVSDKGAGCRFLEIIENPTAQPVQVQVSLYTNVGNSIQGTVLPDSKDGRVPFVALGQGQGAGCSLAYCMSSSKGRLLMRPQANGDDITLAYDPVVLKPNEKIALLHVCAQRNSVAEAEEFAKKLKWADVVHELGKVDRVLVRNIRTGGGLLSVGGVDLFRGEGGDAIRLKSGELLTGSLQIPAFSLETEFGAREVPADQVLSLFDAGDNVRLVNQSGEVLTGKLKSQALKLKLRGGRDLDVPLDCIACYGKRLPQAKAGMDGQVGEPEAAEQFTFTDPVFALRNGDRLVGRPVAEKLEFNTLYGLIPVAVGDLKRIEFPHAELRAPVVELVDGSSFSALPATPALAVKTGAGANVSLDAGRLSVIFFLPAEDLMAAEAEEEAAEEGEEAKQPPIPKPYAELRLLNQDLFCGTLAAADGQLTLETPFGKQRIGVDQIMRLKPRRSGPYRLRVTLWDGNVFPARLDQETVGFKTNGGAKLEVPIGLLRLYWRPLALPPDAEVARMEGLIAKLGDNDPQTREAAQKELIEIGYGARAVLARHWKAEDLEKRTRVRRILEQLQETAPPETLDDEDEEDGATVGAVPAASQPGLQEVLQVDLNRATARSVRRLRR